MSGEERSVEILHNMVIFRSNLLRLVEYGSDVKIMLEYLTHISDHQKSSETIERIMRICFYKDEVLGKNGWWIRTHLPGFHEHLEQMATAVREEITKKVLNE